jgi:hypothetical protein
MLVDGLINATEALTIYNCFLLTYDCKPKCDNKTLAHYITCITLFNKTISNKLFKYLDQDCDTIYNYLNEYAKKNHPAFLRNGFPDFKQEEYQYDKKLVSKLTNILTPIIHEALFEIKTKATNENLIEQANKLAANFLKQKETIDLTEATASAIESGTANKNKK